MGSIHLVLFEPEIPQNTGNIIRTCVATGAVLHLIEPLGFKLTEKEVKRSGVNYMDEIDLRVYKNLDEFYSLNSGEFYYLTRYGQKNIHDVDTKDQEKDYYFMMGKESTGIPYNLLKENFDRCIRLPMKENVRSLNLSNVAAIICYEALRQQDFPGLSPFEPETMKGKDFILKQ